MCFGKIRRGFGSVFFAALVFFAIFLFLPSFFRIISSHGDDFTPIQVSGKTYPLTIIDSLGHETVLKASPRRIVSLTPSLTEILCRIGGDEKLFAVTSFCVKSNPGFSSLLKDKKIIANGINPSAEEIAELAPDLIISVSNSSQEFVDNMRKLGFPVIVFGNESLETILGFIPVLGLIAQRQDHAGELFLELRARLNAIDERVSMIPLSQRPSALIMFDLAGGGAGGKGSFMGDILERAGARNSAADMDSRWPILSAEWIMDKNPDHIFLDDYREGDELDQMMLILKDEIARHPVFGNLSASKNDRLHIIGDNLIVIPGVRTVDAVETLHLILYPESPNLHESSPP